MCWRRERTEVWGSDGETEADADEKVGRSGSKGSSGAEVGCGMSDGDCGVGERL